MAQVADLGRFIHHFCIIIYMTPFKFLRSVVHKMSAIKLADIAAIEENL
jgi:hypothetical protein